MSRPKGWLSDFPNVQDLHELLALDEVKKQVVVWQDEQERIAAFCILDPSDNFLFECADKQVYSLLFKEAVQFCAAILKEKYSHFRNLPALDASSRDNDNLRIKCLLEEGFLRSNIKTVSFARDLGKALPRAILPPGFSIRALNGFHELEAYVSLHQAAFGTGQMTMEFRKSIMASPEYIPDLDLVVLSPDGALAAFCVCQINPSENDPEGFKIGWTDPIGVHPDFRHLGLAKALLSEGFSQLKARGVAYARLSTLSENHAMIGLAKSLGFIETDGRCWYSKKLDANGKKV